MKITLTGFRGANRALHPALIPENVGVESINCNPVRGDLRPWKAPLTVATVPVGRQSIYRMGRDVVNEALYWLSWPTDVDAVRASIADDATERTYYTGDGVPKWTDNTMALATAPYPTAFRLLGVPAPVTALLLSASGGVSATNEVRYYVQTFVTDKGEESAPGPVSLKLTCKIDDTVTITNIASAPAGAYGINRARIYRTQTGLSGDTEFFFLREIASGVASTTDDKRALGEVMPSTTWLTPPADLKALTGMWNGMIAGISGKSVRVCEAYKPYAWPLAYEILPADATPVALKVFGQNLLILTTGRPAVVNGSSPDALDEQPVEWNESCVAKRSAVSFGHGVAWACPDGLAYLGSGGPKMITAGLMTREDWQAIKPETIIGSMYEGAYLGVYTVAGVTKGFLVDPLNPTGMYFTDIPASAFFFDELQDQLFLLDGTNIKKWDAGAALTATFRSKRYRMPKPTSMSCMLVVADSYPVSIKHDALGLAPAVVTALIADNPLLTAPTTTSVRYTVSAADGNAFRLPSGYLYDECQIEVSSSAAVQGVLLSSSIEELAR